MDDVKWAAIKAASFIDARRKALLRQLIINDMAFAMSVIGDVGRAEHSERCNARASQNASVW